jgi:ABC-type ATPase with predicted acetyltransferase domain
MKDCYENGRSCVIDRTPHFHAISARDSRKIYTCSVCGRAFWANLKPIIIPPGRRIFLEAGQLVPEELTNTF